MCCTWAERATLASRLWGAHVAGQRIMERLALTHGACDRSSTEPGTVLARDEGGPIEPEPPSRRV